MVLIIVLVIVADPDPGFRLPPAPRGGSSDGPSPHPTTAPFRSSPSRQAMCGPCSAPWPSVFALGTQTLGIGSGHPGRSRQPGNRHRIADDQLRGHRQGTQSRQHLPEPQGHRQPDPEPRQPGRLGLVDRWRPDHAAPTPSTATTSRSSSAGVTPRRRPIPTGPLIPDHLPPSASSAGRAARRPRPTPFRARGSSTPGSSPSRHGVATVSSKVALHLLCSRRRPARSPATTTCTTTPGTDSSSSPSRRWTGPWSTSRRTTTSTTIRTAPSRSG